MKQGLQNVIFTGTQEVPKRRLIWALVSWKLKKHEETQYQKKGAIKDYEVTEIASIIMRESELLKTNKSQPIIMY